MLIFTVTYSTSFSILFFFALCNTTTTWPFWWTWGHTWRSFLSHLSLDCKEVVLAFIYFWESLNQFPFCDISCFFFLIKVVYTKAFSLLINSHLFFYLFGCTSDEGGRYFFSASPISSLPVSFAVLLASALKQNSR